MWGELLPPELIAIATATTAAATITAPPSIWNRRRRWACAARARSSASRSSRASSLCFVRDAMVCERTPSRRPPRRIDDVPALQGAFLGSTSQSLMHEVDILWRLALALALSSLIGMEREMRQKSAGMRTYTLVGVGSATFMLVSAYGFNDVVGPHVMLDPSRVAAQIVS